MKSLLNKIKSGKKNKFKNNDKIKELETDLVKIKYVNSPNKLQSQLKVLKKIKFLMKI